MKITILLILLVGFVCLGCDTSGPSVVGITEKKFVHPSSSFPMTRPIGRLGLPIGTYLRIEGHRYEPTKPPFKIPARTLLVDTVQGNLLDVPIKISIKNVDTDSLDIETRCVLNGYEAGVWGGSPEGLPPGTPVEQHAFHFRPYFVVISIEAPKGLKVE